MSASPDFDNEERVQKILQDLCVAKFAHHYCSDCTSGKGCCVEEPHSHQVETSPADTELKDSRILKMDPKEMKEVEENTKKGRVRRQKLTIDLSNDESLTDGEILRRLLSPLGSPLSDEPLEVILEIVDEEEEDDENNYKTSTPKKSFRSLREKLREVTGGFPSRDDHKSRGRHQPKRNDDYYCDSVTDRPHKKSYSSVKMCPSYQKANSLINEIERCFLETASLVEKTLETSNSSRNSQEFKDEGINSTLNNKSGIGEHLTQTIEEALQVFDSIMSESKTQKSSQQKNKCYDPIKPKNNKNIYNSHSSFDSYEDMQNNIDIKEPNNSWYSKISQRVNNNLNPNKLRRNNWPNGFEKDIDELFKECYVLSSIEPSTSLGSCLKNLESLCFQLKKAKENILMEMKEEYNKKLDAYDDCFDGNVSQTSSLDSQECLSFINELIERKLKDKFRQKKFSLDPPLMGLEGRTHKIIAEVLPLKLISENGKFCDNENGYYNNCRNNYSKKQDSAYSSNNTVNISLGENDFYSESNSEMSTATNTLDSNRCNSFSPQAISDKSEDHYKYTLSETSEDNNSSMSYEETLALYEDNQELQQSLLSILHSLNDIHDNFLNRRRMEIAMSQKSSDFIQNHLKAEISSSLPKEVDIQPQNNFPQILINNNNFYTKELNYKDKRNLSNKLNEDFESIEKIFKVSEELKNLWLYGTDDLNLKTRKPSRSVSFNRGMKRYKRVLKRHENRYSDEFDYDSVINEKSLSMPNLSILPQIGNDSVGISLDASSTQLPVPFHSENQNQEIFSVINLAKKMKNEDSENNQVKMNFLQRIMDSCSSEDKKEDERCDFLQPDNLHSYNVSINIKKDFLR